jgi:hypothetical protein
MGFEVTSVPLSNGEILKSSNHSDDRCCIGDAKRNLDNYQDAYFKIL